MNKSETIVKLAEALSKAQAEMPAAKFSSINPFLKNKYANLGTIIETAQPVLAKFQLSVSQLVYSEGEQVGVETILMHASGEWLESSISMPTEVEKGKSSAQVAGSIITYLRRYSLAAILGMYADEDGDGNAAKAVQNSEGKPFVPEVKAPPEPETNPKYDLNTLDLSAAMKTVDSEGKPFGEFDNKTLSYMATEYNKRVKLNGDDKVEAKYKLEAAKMIMKERANGSIK